MKDEKKAALGRRDVLRGFGLGALGAGATLTTQLAQPAQADSESGADKRKARYNKDSADVQAYYRVNRYPG